MVSESLFVTSTHPFQLGSHNNFKPPNSVELNGVGLNDQADLMEWMVWIRFPPVFFPTAI